MAALELLALDEATPQARAPGSGDTYLAPRPVTVSIGTITTDIKILDLSATWNAAGVTFTGLKFNVTNTASAAASLLMDLQVGGTTRFKVTPSLGATITSTDSSGQVCVFTSMYGSTSIAVGGGGSTNINNLASTSWGSFSITSGGGNITVLATDAANTLALRNGTNAQTFNRYRSYTDASNYSRLTSKWNTTTAVIHAEGLGTGTDGNIAFNDAALATTATVGYVMIPSCAGAPTGVPADIPTGQVALHFDSTNNKLYVYDGGWLSTAALT